MTLEGDILAFHCYRETPAEIFKKTMRFICNTTLEFQSPDLAGPMGMAGGEAFMANDKDRAPGGQMVPS